MIEYPETPEWDRMLEIQPEWDAISKFLVTLLASNATIGEFVPANISSTQVSKTSKFERYTSDEIESLKADHFGIDLAKVKEEQKAVLDFWIEEKRKDHFK